MATLAHKIQLTPTPTQVRSLARAVGCARFAWNWNLAEWKRQYTAHKADPTLPRPRLATIQAAWSQVKHTEFPWLAESPANANLYPLVSLDGAFRRFFAKTAKHPKFKRKGQRDSFYVDNQKLRLDARSAKLPKIGRVKLTESLRFRGRVLHGTVSREAGRWFLSVTVELTEPDYRRTGDGVVGVDLGIAKLATLSTGEIIENPRPLQRRLARLQRLSQAHSRKVKGSRNRYKAARRLAQLHWRIRNVRQDTMHKLTTRLCRENQTVGIENLNVKGMVRNRKLARAISDAAFGEFRRQLTYKAALYGTRVVVVDRFYPSSKTCSACGVVNQGLVLSDRVFCCPTCGFTLDRDHNAAINLCAKAHEATPGMGGSYACGESVRPESLGYPAILVEAGSST